jgi:hypothetical protein
MKRFIVLAVLGLALASAPVLAHGYGGGKLSVGVGGNVWWNWSPCGPGGGGGGGGGAGGGGLGPWYQYWPYEAHFMTPALPQYPYWGSPQTLPGGSPFATPGMFQPSTPPPYWH